MRLIFTKDDKNEIKVQLQKGTILEDFSYVEMVSQLLKNNKFENNVYTNLDDEEKSKIEEMLKEISETFEENDASQNENFEDLL